MTHSGNYGLLAEFVSSERLTMAIRRARHEGYTELEAFAPVPVEEASEQLTSTRTWVPACTLFGGLLGVAIGYAVQVYTNVLDYPINVGGRPLHSWPAFAVVTIEMGILVAALGAAVGMLALNGLPRPHHPLFNVPEFALASQTRFFLCIRADDAKFDLAETHRFLTALGGVGVWEVPLTVVTSEDQTGEKQ